MARGTRPFLASGFLRRPSRRGARPIRSADGVRSTPARSARPDRQRGRARRGQIGRGSWCGPSPRRVRAPRMLTRSRIERARAACLAVRYESGPKAATSVVSRHPPPPVADCWRRGFGRREDCRARNASARRIIVHRPAPAAAVRQERTDSSGGRGLTYITAALSAAWLLPRPLRCEHLLRTEASCPGYRQPTQAPQRRSWSTVRIWSTM